MTKKTHVGGKETVVKKSVKKRIMCSILSIMLMFAISVVAMAEGPEEEEAVISVDKSVLLDAAQPAIDAYAKYYEIISTDVVSAVEESKDGGGSYIKYVLDFAVKLKYTKAT